MIEDRRDELIELEASLPVGSPAAKLSRNALLGLDRLEEILRQPITPEMDVKQQRLIGDMAIASEKLLMQAAGQEFQMRRDDALGRVLELIAAERASKS